MAKNSRDQIRTRRKQILEILGDGQTTVDVLAKQLDVSPMTIRRDVKAMADQQILQQNSAGVVSSKDSLFVDPGYAKRHLINRREKIAIAMEAAKLVKNGMVVGMDASTTSIETAKQLLGSKDIHVITNSLLVPQVLATHSSAMVEVAGGSLRSAALSTIGAQTCRHLARYSYDIVFISANAVDEEYGLTDTSSEEIETKITMLENAKKKVLLADSSKIGRRSLCRCCGIDEIDVLITDKGVTQEQYDAFADRNVHVIVTE